MGFVDIAYPGSNEPISVDNIDKLDLLCPDVNPNQAESDLNFMGWAV